MARSNHHPAMFTNRISRFFTDEAYEAKSPARPGFVPLPAFAMVQAGPGANIYQVAYQQAQVQVARRHERRRRAHEWN